MSARRERPLAAPTLHGEPLPLTALCMYEPGKARRLRIVRRPPRLCRWRVVCRRQTGRDRTLQIDMPCSLDAAIEMAMEEVAACKWTRASLECYAVEGAP